MAKDGLTRYAMQFDAETLRILDNLKADLGAASLTEVVRRGIRLHDIINDASRAGKTILIRDKDGSEKEVLVS